MEKLKFTLRFLALLALLPAIMYADLSRKDKVKTEIKKTPAEKVSVVSSCEGALCCQFSFKQAVYN